jgi:hypothetical protein
MLNKVMVGLLGAAVASLLAVVLDMPLNRTPGEWVNDWWLVVVLVFVVFFIGAKSK